MTSFTVLPAVDIAGGRCVQLRRGDPEASTVYYDDPVDAARRWVDEGAVSLHVVDLDAALGRGTNRDVVTRVVAASSVPVQVAGGIRDAGALDDAFSTGAARVVVGTAAAEHPELVEAMARAHPGQVVVAADVKDGEVTVAGWTRGSGRTVGELAGLLRDLDLGGLLVTDVSRDGVLTGPNVELYRALAGEVDTAVIASGGVRDVADVVALAEAGCAGVIVGTALYEGRLRLTDAIEATT